MATVNGFKMDDVIDIIQSGRLTINAAELFALLKSQLPPDPKQRPRDLQDLLLVVHDCVRN